jgi:virginiamycin B lyase
VTPIVEPEHCQQCTGTITPGAPQAITPGNTATFSLAPNNGATLLGASSDCGGSLVDATTFITAPIKKACSVYAAFRQTYQLSLPAEAQDSVPYSLTQGPDGKIWFIMDEAPVLGNITANGEVTYVTDIQQHPHKFLGLTMDSNHKLWALAWNDLQRVYLDQLNADGTIANSYQIDSQANLYDYSSLVTTANGYLFVLNDNVSTSKVIRFAIDSHTTQSYFSGDSLNNITTATDNTIWVTGCADSACTQSYVGKISANGEAQKIALPAKVEPSVIAQGSDKNIWFVDEETNQIYKMSTDGKILGTYPALSKIYRIDDLKSGADGNLWFLASYIYSAVPPEVFPTAIGKITTGGVVTIYPMKENRDMTSLVLGPNNNLWFSSYDKDSQNLNYINKL